MTTARFTVEERYRPRAGDLLVLPYLKKTALFADSRLPGTLRPAAAPKDPGASAVSFAGRVGRGKGADVLAIAARVDTKDRPDAEGVKAAVARAIEAAKREKRKRVVVALDARNGADFAASAHEGAALGGYRFDRYKKEKTPVAPVVAVLGRSAKRARREVRLNAPLFEEVNAARDLANEPGNVANPAHLARAFTRAGRRVGMRVEVWDRKRLAHEGCRAILAVGSASATPPRLVIGRYTPRRRARGHLALVGKGVTFDTGGYSLKPSANMHEMKGDMSGAAAAFHAACVAARWKLPLRVTVVTPLVENAVSGSGYRPGDILRTRAGRSVQVDNTDAEGRLILTDALDVAASFEPTVLVDVATLTGACMVALGTEIAGLYVSKRSLAREIVAAGEAWGERFWEMPLYKPYAKQLKTPLADLKNIGERWGGSINAALFLQHWVPPSLPWAHLDIAGPAFGEKGVNHLGPGSRGFAVKTLSELARRLA